MSLCNCLVSDHFYCSEKMRFYGVKTMDKILSCTSTLILVYERASVAPGMVKLRQQWHWLKVNEEKRV